MYFKLMGKLSARRKAILEEEKEQGFTLIELLVVVVIIGILAAIAIPIYIGVQNGAKDAAAKSDLTNAKTAVIAYYADKGDAAAAPTTAGQLSDYGYTISDAIKGNAIFVTDTKTFCISEQSASGNFFKVVGNTTVAAAAAQCANAAG